MWTGACQSMRSHGAPRPREGSNNHNGYLTKLMDVPFHANRRAGVDKTGGGPHGNRAARFYLDLQSETSLLHGIVGAVI